MEPEERPTKRERRERARAERREQAETEVRDARWRGVRNATVTVVAVVGVAAIVIGTRPAPVETVEVSAEEATEAADTAGCDTPQLTAGSGAHLEPQSAPSPAELYPERPAHSGPHFGMPMAPVGFIEDGVDERAVLHNLEHGSVIAWFDPSTIDEEDRDEVERWVRERNRAGFSLGRGGVGVIASPFEDGLDGKAVALRGWGAATDCGDFDVTVADAFLARNFGDRGQAPEGGMAPFPSEALRVVDDAGADGEDG